MSAFVPFITARSGTARWLMLAISVFAGFAASEIYRSEMERENVEALSLQAQRTAANILTMTVSGRAMGAVRLAGLTDTAIRAAARATAPLDQDQVLQQSLESISRVIEGDGTFIVNAAGMIVASWDAQGRSRLGANIGFRPYVQSTLRGKESVYAAVGSNTGDRALYIAAPVFANSLRDTTVSGVISGRISLAAVDRALRDWHGIALLLSPQGVVFASNRDGWLFRLAGAVTMERIKRIAGLTQFGPFFNNDNGVHPLPFDPAAPIVTIEGRRYTRAEASLPWLDPNGDWSVMLLEDLSGSIPVTLRAGIGFLSGLGVWLVLLAAVRALRDAEQRRQAMAAAQEAAERMASEAHDKSREAEFTARMQQARDLPALAGCLFDHLTAAHPIHQASLYTLVSGPEGNDRLRLAGSYADSDAVPELMLGQGLAGQCALDRQAIVVSADGAGVRWIRSGLGATAPKTLLVLPIQRNDRVVGVLELGSLDPGLATAREEIGRILTLFALNLDVLLAALRAGEQLSEELRLQRSLGRETESWLHSVLDGVPDAVLVADTGGRIVLANQAASRLFGYEVAELLALMVKTVLPDGLFFGEQTQAARSNLSAAHDPEALSSMRALTRGGEQLAVEVKCAALPETPLRGTCYCAIIRHASAATG